MNIDKKIQINMLLDEYEACKRVLKEDRSNKYVKGFFKRIVILLKELGLTTVQIKSKTSL